MNKTKPLCSISTSERKTGLIYFVSLQEFSTTYRVHDQSVKKEGEMDKLALCMVVANVSNLFNYTAIPIYIYVHSVPFVLYEYCRIKLIG